MSYLQKYHNNTIVKINIIDNDYGPISKLFGIIKTYPNIINKNTLIILVDDDMYYKPYMIDMFYKSFKKDIIKKKLNAYSFNVVNNYTNKCKVGFGADGFAFNSNALTDIIDFYNKCIKLNNKLFYHDDLVISKYLSLNHVTIKKLKVKKGDKLIYDLLSNNANSLNKLNNELGRNNLNHIKISVSMNP